MQVIGGEPVHLAHTVMHPVESPKQRHLVSGTVSGVPADHGDRQSR
jgi:hypothetical protein